MYQVRRVGNIGYEDLMRELELIEQQVIKDDPSLGMSLMALDAKIRDRFRHMDSLIEERIRLSEIQQALEDELPLDEIKTLVPREAVDFPTYEEYEVSRKRKRLIETIAMAALLAILTALGVFGLASLLQLTLSWLA